MMPIPVNLGPVNSGPVNFGQSFYSVWKREPSEAKIRLIGNEIIPVWKEPAALFAINTAWELAPSSPLETVIPDLMYRPET
jgi:hypothetical protein